MWQLPLMTTGADCYRCKAFPVLTRRPRSQFQFWRRWSLGSNNVHAPRLHCRSGASVNRKWYYCISAVPAASGAYRLGSPFIVQYAVRSTGQVCSYIPYMTSRVHNSADSITPRLIRGRQQYYGAGFHGTVYHDIYVVNV